jgi:hypothetical protein
MSHLEDPANTLLTPGADSAEPETPIKVAVGHGGRPIEHGGRSRLQRPEQLAAIAGKRAEVIDHLGGDPTLIQADLATDYSRVDTLIETVAKNIETNGILTSKGHTRAAVSMFLSLLDRRLRLAQVLGIERKAKPVKSLAEVMRGE